MSEFSKKYILSVIEKYQTGHAREHAYRPVLEKLFKNITKLKVINDPKRSEYGSPDFVFLKDKMTLAYAETKDIGISLDETEKSDQMIRYHGYSNLILTDYLEFRFYRNGQNYCEAIKIAELKDGTIVPIENKYSLLEDTIKDFINESREPIKSGLVLAKVMAGKARRIRDNIKTFLTSEDIQKNANLLGIYNVIKKLLLAELDYEKFADMYAQTLVYGLFVARYYDKSPNDFSRQEARDLVPASNPFLKSFFDHIAGSSFDKRIEIIVNELCEEFTHADIQAIIHDYYKVEKDSSRDPIIHFYEDFLQEYDPQERKKMGVFYTPLPVVKFIVRAIDDILKTEFNLPQGLADTSKIEIKKETQGKKHKALIHRVQILDPATGTGTFLNEIIMQIKKSFQNQEGCWNGYVNNDLLPRLHGFELMMASYTIAHLKLSSTIQETGAEAKDKRLGVYLTNSLEKTSKYDDTLFASIGFGKALTEESNQANKVKKDLPIMVIVGNPPYSGISQNKKYTDNNVYKVEPGGKEKLKERKNWLDDDYIKFIRLAESLIEKNKEGIVGMITSHGYIENPTCRGMRWHLKKTFDSIYIIDLHGNSNKKETTPNGGKDENVFNIKTGVSIILGIKKNNKSKKVAEIYKTDLFGLKKEKFEKLESYNFKKIDWVNLPKNNDIWCIEGNGKSEYQKGFSITELFPKNSTGIVTMGDGFIINQNKEKLKQRVDDFLNTDINESQLKSQYNLGKNYAKWIINNKNEIKNSHKKIIALSYRPFDTKFTYFDRNLIWRIREQIMKNFIDKENIGLLFSRMTKGKDFSHIFITKNVSEAIFLSPLTGTNAFNAPLYLYAEDNSKIPNLDKNILSEIEKITGKNEPEDILDYIYAILHSPNYRKKYQEFLKTDFPRAPYPKNEKQFQQLVKLGKKLRGLHLFESPELNKFITTFPESGSDTIEKKYPKYENQKVYINENQYFGDVPEIAWNFYVGGYQPAQKWLKDRKNKKLNNEDIEHYQKIIIALTETDKIMKKIDKIKTI